MIKKITYATGNKSKLLTAQTLLAPLGFEIDNKKINPIEIQADTTEEIAIFSAKDASIKLNTSALKNDSGLYVDALNGFPGPYTHYVDDTLGEDGLLKLLEGVENRSAHFVEAYAFCELGKEPVVFTSITKGTIAKEKQGTYGWSWDFIFIPEGDTKTLACYDDNERMLKWNNDGLYKLADYLKTLDK